MRYIYLFSFVFFLFSCVSDGLDRPNEDKIISDLIGRKVGTWTFLNEDEFVSLNITSSKIISTTMFSLEDDELVLDISGEFIDYDSREKYSGEIFVTYKLNDYFTWIFDRVDGEISRSANENNENLIQSSESFHIEYPLIETIEIRACDNCSHQIQEVTNIEFPDYTFKSFDDENLMNELWKKHKEDIESEYRAESFLGLLIRCENCDAGSGYYTVDRFTNKIVMTFERN
jgi:hypothetical protein